MYSQFDAFVGSIGLSGPDAQALRSSYGSNPADKLSAACLATQLVLGKDAVDTAPLIPNVVEANWSKANVAKPHCVVAPTSVHAVSVTIKVLAFFQVKFAVRSGGHSPNPGFSSVGDSGILLDLSKLDRTTLSEDKKVVSVGPGQRWGKVYSFLDAYGLSVTGGRIPNVGVGGSFWVVSIATSISHHDQLELTGNTATGGLHHFSAKYGLAADNVHNFEVVLSDGNIINSNAKENTDLFWALKGGGPNFGVVTRFDLYTVPTRNIWLRLTVHALDQANDIFDAFADWQKQGGATDSRATVITGIALDSIAIGLVYEMEDGDTSTFEPAPATFAPLDSLPFLQVLADGVPTTLLALMDQMGAATTSAATRHDYRAASSRIDAQLYKDVYAFWRARALAAREATGANQTFVLQPIPRSLAQAGAAKGGNPMGIPNEDHQWWTTLVDWTDAAHDGDVRAVGIDTTRQWAKLGQERGLHLPFLFQGDSSRDQSPLASYGEENVAKLKQIALKYDKTQFFQKLQNGGFYYPRSNQVNC
ncbi:FAD-binding domain-containing protein [Apiospora rasikravindrae]|uniref:FAD-binding domain-containing protein n=1 Tax=Apiospora rasikravindrae TaxID=990691 RepID=A0ABR1SQZ5_9PEZI